MSDWFSLVISAPVRTSVSDALPRRGLDAAGQLLSLTEPSPLTSTASTKPGWPTNSCAVGRSNSANVAPPGESASPKRAMPDERELAAAALADDRDLVADREVALLEAARSMRDLGRRRCGLAPVDEASTVDSVAA